MRWVRIIILVWIVIGLAGCSRMIANMHKAPHDIQTREYARQLYQHALQKNPAPETFKGIGNIKIIRDGYVESGRIAWMASGRDKIRFELLTPYGQPWAGFSSDGQYLYILVYADQSFYQKSLSKSDLKQIISVSVQPEEIISLLSGRPPEIDYSFISLIEPKTASGTVLVLQKKWWRGHQKLYFDESDDYIRTVEVYDGSGELKYKADLLLKTEKDHFVPHRLDITDGRGTIVQLVVNRYWPDVDVSPSSFVLAPPGG